ncbi:hypothetical protein [Paenibacillus kribbensis]|uniref:hypothetical protein n=1 Tax=Paenibacillus kribbensis TaxID=172713 RepID=UPI0012FDA17B|nr:hypothetical protein [Paenibacillus kribbensis]
MNAEKYLENGVGGMVLYKRSGRFVPGFLPIKEFIPEIRGRWRWEAPSDCAVAQ